MVTVETIVKCDICGKEMKESKSGHKRFQGYLVLGSNLDESDSKKYDDVCVDCCLKIKQTINELSGMSVVNRYFSEKLDEIEYKSRR